MFSEQTDPLRIRLVFNLTLLSGQRTAIFDVLTYFYVTKGKSYKRLSQTLGEQQAYVAERPPC